MCHGQKSRFIGDGHPTFNDGILIMGPYKPLRNWVDDHPLLYGNNGSLDPGTNGRTPWLIHWGGDPNHLRP